MKLISLLPIDNEDALEEYLPGGGIGEEIPPLEDLLGRVTPKFWDVVAAHWNDGGIKAAVDEFVEAENAKNKPSGGKDDGGIPAELVAVWYADAEFQYKFFEITSNGKALMGEGTESFELDVTVSGGNITFSGLGMTFMEIKSYTVEGKQLTGTFFSYTEPDFEPIPNAAFYKQ
jgi:hypothetical protein